MSSKSRTRTFKPSSLSLNIAPQPKAVRAREPITPSRGKVRVQFPSTKLGRMIACESQLEQKFCYHAEFSPAISSFREQPVSIHYPMNGKMLRYTPDFELTFYNGDIWYVEIKPHYKLLQSKFRNKFQHIARFWNEKKYPFILVTDQELNFPTRLRNLRLLRAYLRQKLDVRDLNFINEVFKNTNSLSIAELTNVFGSTSKVYTLLAQNYLITNLERPLNLDSQLKSPKEKSHETCLFTYRTGPSFERCALPVV